jgi:hypothetical protein
MNRYEKIIVDYLQKLGFVQMAAILELYKDSLLIDVKSVVDERVEPIEEQYYRMEYKTLDELLNEFKYKRKYECAEAVEKLFKKLITAEYNSLYYHNPKVLEVNPEKCYGERYDILIKNYGIRKKEGKE